MWKYYGGSRTYLFQPNIIDWHFFIDYLQKVDQKHGRVKVDANVDMMPKENGLTMEALLRWCQKTHNILTNHSK